MQGTSNTQNKTKQNKMTDSRAIDKKEKNSRHTEEGHALGDRGLSGEFRKEGRASTCLGECRARGVYIYIYILKSILLSRWPGGNTAG
jgi:hypothetical protein